MRDDRESVGTQVLVTPCWRCCVHQGVASCNSFPASFSADLIRVRRWWASCHFQSSGVVFACIVWVLYRECGEKAAIAGTYCSCCPRLASCVIESICLSRLWGVCVGSNWSLLVGGCMPELPEVGTRQQGTDPSCVATTGVLQRDAVAGHA